MIDEYTTYLTGIIDRYLEQNNNVDCELLRIEETKKRKEFDKLKQERTIKKLFSMKKYAKQQIRELDRDLKRLAEEEAYICDQLDDLDKTIKMYEQLSKKVEITSEYRKRLDKIVDLYNEFEKRMDEIRRPKSYYEKSAELTEKEQVKIIFKILMEKEDTLTRDEIIEEILDMEHYKDYMKSLIRVFKTPSIMGFKPTYKSDYIWVTVEAPPKLWSDDLNQELYTALAGYVTSEVSRTITVRVIEARDEWITRVLVVGGRGKGNHLEAFDEMQLLYSKSNDFERNLSRSYLLEHGTSAIEAIDEINKNTKK